MPTSLTYIVLSTRGCSPWRPAADIGTARHENNTVSLGFSRADESAPDTARAAVLYGLDIPLSAQGDSRESGPYKEKRTLPRAPADVSEFVCVAALDPASGRANRPLTRGGISVSGFGNIDPNPFRGTRGYFWCQKIQSRFLRTEFSYPLGPTDPCSTAVHMEPFSTSVFKVLI